MNSATWFNAVYENGRFVFRGTLRWLGFEDDDVGGGCHCSPDGKRCQGMDSTGRTDGLIAEEVGLHLIVSTLKSSQGNGCSFGEKVSNIAFI